MITMTPLVSIILPTFNRSHIIDRAILSVFSQTYSNYELLVIDDGSTDDTQARIESYGDRIHYIKQDNQGVSAARNAGIRVAKGDYIAFIDSDDAWHSEKLAAQISFFNENTDKNIALVSTDVRMVDNKGNYYARKRRVEKTGSSIMSFLAVFEDPYLGLPTVMINRSCIFENNVFDESLKTAEDLDLYLRLAKSYSIGYLHKKLVDVHESDDSLSNSSKSYEDNIYVLKKHENFSGLDTYKKTYNKIMHDVYLDYAKAMLWKGDLENSRRQIVNSLKYKLSVCAAYYYLKSILKVITK